MVHVPRQKRFVRTSFKHCIWLGNTKATFKLHNQLVIKNLIQILFFFSLPLPCFISSRALGRQIPKKNTTFNTHKKLHFCCLILRSIYFMNCIIFLLLELNRHSLALPYYSSDLSLPVLFTIALILYKFQVPSDERQKKIRESFIFHFTILIHRFFSARFSSHERDHFIRRSKIPAPPKVDTLPLGEKLCLVYFYTLLLNDE